MTEDGKVTPKTTPYAKRFQDDINSLKEFEGGDDIVFELDGGLRKVCRLYADDFCAIDLNVIEAKCWSTSNA